MYDVSIRNMTAASAATDIWIDIAGPGFTITKGPVSRTVSAAQTIGTTLAQSVPAGAAAGLYTLTLYTGTFPVPLFADSFTYEKTAAVSPTPGPPVNSWASTLDRMPGLPTPAGVQTSAVMSASASKQATAQVNVNALNGNFPNPFSDATTIEYSLEKAGPVRLVVFDMLGREVSVLADGWQAAGRHRARFSGQDLPSGLYVYELNAGSFVQTRSMVRIH